MKENLINKDGLEFNVVKICRLSNDVFKSLVRYYELIFGIETNIMQKEEVFELLVSNLLIPTLAKYNNKEVIRFLVWDNTYRRKKLFTSAYLP